MFPCMGYDKKLNIHLSIYWFAFRLNVCKLFWALLTYTKSFKWNRVYVVIKSKFCQCGYTVHKYRTEMSKYFDFAFVDKLKSDHSWWYPSKNISIQTYLHCDKIYIIYYIYVYIDMYKIEQVKERFVVQWPTQCQSNEWAFERTSSLCLSQSKCCIRYGHNENYFVRVYRNLIVYSVYVTSNMCTDTLAILSKDIYV